MVGKAVGTLGLITARGGSKRVPGKNARLLGGKPLIAWTIAAARHAKGLDRVIVSTDDRELADLSQRYGAEVPFLRPAELASDTASHFDVIKHAVDFLEDVGTPVRQVCLLQPTSPFRRAKHIDDLISECEAAGAESAVSVTPAPHPVYLRLRDRDGRISPFQEQPPGYLRSQDLPSIYRLNGAIYLFSVEGLRTRSSELGANPFGFVMSELDSLDIDTLDDFAMAEAIVAAGIMAFPQS